MSTMLASRSRVESFAELNYEVLTAETYVVLLFCGMNASISSKVLGDKLSVPRAGIGISLAVGRNIANVLIVDRVPALEVRNDSSERLKNSAPAARSRCNRESSDFCTLLLRDEVDPLGCILRSSRVIP